MIWNCDYSVYRLISLCLEKRKQSKLGNNEDESRKVEECNSTIDTLPGMSSQNK